MPEIKDDRYRHSVLWACETLHGHMLGSGDPLSDEHFHELTEWLRWRITARPHGDDSGGWKPTEVGDGGYDAAVWGLGHATLVMIEDYKRGRRWRGLDAPQNILE